MSDDWRYFPCTIGDSKASIFFDLGVADSIANAPPRLLKLRLRYRQPRDDGLPTSAEFEAVNAVEDQLQLFARLPSDWYVGRTTFGGARTFYIYTTRPDDSWHAFAGGLSDKSGYKLDLDFTDDAEHRGYAEELYPTEDDWRVIADLGVLDALRERGDDGSQPRRVDHWLYFQTEAAANEFVAWATGHGFDHDTQFSTSTDDGRYCLRLHHHGPAVIADLTRYTLALDRRARKCGADYDGWETEIIKREG